LDIETYRLRKFERESAVPRSREMCLTCRQPAFGCYCEAVRRFDPGLRFVILIHPIEVKRRIASGRMSHLCLERSELIEGKDYSLNKRVNEIVSDPSLQPFILYPGPQAANLSRLSVGERTSLFDPNRELVIFVIDGTWATARKMMRSENLRSLPRLCFSPEKPSMFRVRKQPAPGCVSTIEAIHQTIDLLGEAVGLDVTNRRHDALLDVFETMVERQLRFVAELKATRTTHYRRPKVKKLFSALES